MIDSVWAAFVEGGARPGQNRFGCSVPTLALLTACREVRGFYKPDIVKSRWNSPRKGPIPAQESTLSSRSGRGCIRDWKWPCTQDSFILSGYYSPAVGKRQAPAPSRPSA